MSFQCLVFAGFVGYTLQQDIFSEKLNMLTWVKFMLKLIFLNIRLYFKKKCLVSYNKEVLREIIYNL